MSALSDVAAKLLISIHALRGEGDVRRAGEEAERKNFNPRPPWGGRPRRRAPVRAPTAYFNPRPPWGGRLARGQGRAVPERISIHALRGEGDVRRAGEEAERKNFNPRPPWGGRPRRRAPVRAPTAYFNPRPPWGGRLARGQGRAVPERISIHALRGEGDRGRRSTYP